MTAHKRRIEPFSREQIRRLNSQIRMGDYDQPAAIHFLLHLLETGQLKGTHRGEVQVIRRDARKYNTDLFYDWRGVWLALYYIKKYPDKYLPFKTMQVLGLFDD